MAYELMPRVKLTGGLERSAAEDLWKHTLSQIPTVYGRVTYLASLRDQNSGIYRHHGLAVIFGREESSKALRDSHQEVFAEWLNLSLKDKWRDLAQYFESLEEPLGMVVAHLLDSGIYKTQVPDSARKMERELFCADLEALLQTVRNALRNASDRAS